MWVAAGRRTASILVVVLLGLAWPLHAQTAADEAAERARAFELYRASKFPEALPLLQRLHAAKPEDIAVLEALSFATLGAAAVLQDQDARMRERARARKLAEEARRLGDDSNLLKALLMLPEDGAEVPFSNKADVDAAMKEGEALFVRGDFERAVVAYQRALALDPNQYYAALFIGDTFFKRREYDQASPWFQRAVQINPNSETAYRYWGDTLAAQNRPTEAAEKFIAAVVAEPYGRQSWMGLTQWAQAQRVSLAHPVIDLQDPKNVTVAAVLSNYQQSRESWRADKFRLRFPAETEYRHSLAEEVESLSALIDGVKPGPDLDPAMTTLVSLSAEGLLEPYVLISRADAGIARDYAAYRAADREKIFLYIARWIVRPPLKQ